MSATIARCVLPACYVLLCLAGCPLGRLGPLATLQYAYYGADGKKYFWDLAPLCSERGYSISTADNRTYGYNSKINCRTRATPASSIVLSLQSAASLS